MPRIANEGPKVTEWYDKHGEGSSTFDLCVACATRYEGKPLPAKLVPYGPHDEPRGDVMDIGPMADVEDEGMGPYHCENCGVKLHSRNY